MSRLQAPGFSSRLKAPGFARPSSTKPKESDDQASQVDYVFKRPQDVPSSIPVSSCTNTVLSRESSVESGLAQPVTRGLVRPGSNVTRMKIPNRTGTSDPQQVPSSTHHGPSPYDRGKPQTSHIPYVGKKRVTGSLKAPESKLSRPSMPPKAKDAVVIARSSDSNCSVLPPKHAHRTKPSEGENILQSVLPAPTKIAESVPVKRQLIPESKPQSKLGRPRSFIGNSNITNTQTKQSGLLKPRASRGSIPTGSIPAPTGGLNSSNRGLSRSLQSISGGTKSVRRSSILNKSVSQENLPVCQSIESSGDSVKSKPLKECSSTKDYQTNSVASIIRPRMSTHNNPSNTTVNISTPYHTIKTDTQHLKEIKISPISSVYNDPNATFDVSYVGNKTLVDDALTIEEVDPAQPSNKTVEGGISEHNRTYSTEAIINRLEVSSYECLDYKDVPHGVIEETNLNKTLVICSGDKAEYNSVPNQVKLPDQNAAPSESFNGPFELIFGEDEGENFMDNVAMPEYLYIDTPRKFLPGEIHLNESNQSFSEDILKVIAAISSGVDTHPSQAVSMSTSPIKASDTTSSIHSTKPSVQPITNKCYSEYDVIETPRETSEKVSKEEMHVDVVTHSTFVVRTTGVDSVLPSKPDQLEFRDNHFTRKAFSNVASETVEKETLTAHKTETRSTARPIPIPGLCNDTEADARNVNSLQSESTDLQLNCMPQTPVGSIDEPDFDINTRCNTIALGMLDRSRRNRFNKKVSRSKTFGSQDLISRFRTPKETNLAETVDGKISMDNTTFLHFSNEVKALKTYLLKLKRTLLESECPSPLVKPPLKRSTSAKVSSFGYEMVPPLSPRSSWPSPMAVIDPLVLAEPINNNIENAREKDGKYSASGNREDNREEDVAYVTEKYNDALRKLEELEKENDAKDYTIKLLQTQLERKDEAEQELEEQNIMLQHEVLALTEKLQRVNAAEGDDGGEIFSSGSFKDDFLFADQHMSSRTDILKRMYSNESKGQTLAVLN